MATSAADAQHARHSQAPTSQIGLFGGTFDPVHHGHLRVALDALEALDLDAVHLVPLARAVHRDQPETPARLRLAMLEAAVAGRPQLVADARELERQGPSYTVDTLRSLHAECPGKTLCLLLGADAFNGFPDWREPNTILNLANIAILQRPGVRLAAKAQALLLAHEVNQLEPQQTGQIVACPVAQLAIASSDIRHRRAAGRGIDYLVPDAVLDVIERHGLYR